MDTANNTPQAITARPLIKPAYTSTHMLPRWQWALNNAAALRAWFAALGSEGEYSAFVNDQFHQQFTREYCERHPFVSHAVENYEINCRAACALARKRGLQF